MDADGSAMPLSQLRGYRIANGALDMRGWDVLSADGRRIGGVDEVLVHTGTRQVRYLDVEVETLVVTGRERHVLIPVDQACRDPARPRAVVVEGLAARDVPRLASYPRGAAVGANDAAIARPLSPAPPHDAAHEPLDLPIRVEPPLVIRPIRLPPLQPRRGPGEESGTRKAMPAVPGKLAAKPAAASAGPRAA